MELIGNDEVLFELLKTWEVTIHDSVVKRINIFIEETNGLHIEIDFDDAKYKGNYLRLRFSGIKEYSFYHNNTYHFYNVESFKLIKDGEFFYLSLDPEDESSTFATDHDQDLIVFKSFEGYFIEPY